MSWLPWLQVHEQSLLVLALHPSTPSPANGGIKPPISPQGTRVYLLSCHWNRKGAGLRGLGKSGKDCYTHARQTQLHSRAGFCTPTPFFSQPEQ